MTRTPRYSGSRSFRYRWRIRSRRTLSARRESSMICRAPSDMVSRPRILNQVKMLAAAGIDPANFRRFQGMGPTQCHDITAYPAIGYAGGACSGYGLLLDIHDVAHPVRVGAVIDSNMAAWHSVTLTTPARRSYSRTSGAEAHSPVAGPRTSTSGVRTRSTRCRVIP